MVECQGQAGVQWEADIFGEKVRFPAAAFYSSYEHLRATGADVSLADYVEAVVVFLAANYSGSQDAVYLLSHIHPKAIGADKLCSIQILQVLEGS
jgi:hypothetical protein